MGEVEVFQRHTADVIIVIHLVGVRVGVALLIRPCVRFVIIAFLHHLLGENVLPVKQGLERKAHLIQRPCPLMERRKHGAVVNKNWTRDFKFST